MRTCDVLVIGGGVMGVALALALKRRLGQARVVLIDKEPVLGAHASGRNSGVLHAGFYYTADSLKARFTRDGCLAWTEYSLERGLPINRCGKLVVARDERELAGLHELARRGRANGVSLSLIDAAEARSLEPRIRTLRQALWSPCTASVDPGVLLHSLAADAKAAGVCIEAGVAYLGRQGAVVRSSAGPLEAGYVVNAAGLYADRVARDFGFSRRYRILPFKGLYLYSSEAPGTLHTHVYPVPDLRHPFLGVHYTLTVEGRAKIGPTAIPAFWREHYGALQGFSWRELREVLGLQALLLLSNRFGFGRLALHESQKYFRRRMVAFAASLLDGVRPEHYRSWGRPGVRAQLVDLERRQLEMDFKFEGDAHSFHLLNAVSPAFTCALPFSAWLAGRIETLMAGRGAAAPGAARR